MLKGISRFIARTLHRKQENTASGVCILPRSEHPISRSEIHEGAIKVLYRLHNSGHQAYLVGGCLRDRLLGQEPKDFDVATDATPEEINALFRSARIIGRRFKIVHVRFGREIIEVTTFRGQSQSKHTSAHHQQSEEGMLLRDNVWGSIEEDAARRDFTVNALYYNIADFSLYDFTGGLDDLQQRQLRLIGDPEVRYREDPVRMLRAIRFMAKLDFDLEEKTAAPIREHAELLLQIPPARLFDEVLKLFLSGQAVKTFRLLQDYHLFEMLFPATHEAFKTQATSLQLVEQALTNTDQRIAEGRPVTPAFLYAALLWPGLQQIREDLEKRGTPPVPALQQASTRLLQRQSQHITIPKRFSFPMREIWDLQLKLPKRQGKQAWRLFSTPRFRAAYDFLLLRETVGEPTEGLAAWWTRFQEVSASEQEQLIAQLGQPKKAPRRRRRKKATSPQNQ